jgi:hypothetical protein
VISSETTRRRTLEQIGRECGHKKRYDDALQAELVAESLEPSHGYMESYPCRWCGGWHIGHPAGYGGHRGRAA